MNDHDNGVSNYSILSTMIPLIDARIIMGMEKIGNVRKEGLSIPVRALSSLLMIFVLIPTLEFHSDGF